MLALARERRARLAGLAAELEALSHARVLLRGYAVVWRGEGGTATGPMTAAAQIAPGDALTLSFHDGEVRARAEGAARPPAGRGRRVAGTPEPCRDGAEEAAVADDRAIAGDGVSGAAPPAHTGRRAAPGGAAQRRDGARPPPATRPGEAEMTGPSASRPSRRPAAARPAPPTQETLL